MSLKERIQSMPTRTKALAAVGSVAAVAVLATTAFVVGSGAIDAKNQADRAYAQHHPVGVTPEQRIEAERKVKQQAAADEQKRQQANADAGDSPNATYTPPPQPQVAVNRAMPVGNAAAGSPARSTTGLYAGEFGKDLLMARAMVSGSSTQPIAVTLAPDACMESWVLDHLHDYDGKSAYGVTTVCGRQVALIAGGGGIDQKVLLFGAAQKDGPADVRYLLLESTGSTVSFASSASTDGRTVIMIAAIGES